MANELSRVEQAMIKLDETVQQFTLAQAPEVGHSFVECLRKAAIVKKLEELLSDEVVTCAIIPLKDKSFGFRTDEEARIKKGWSPYSVSQIRNVMIDAIMRGLRPVNNELNIISGNLYAAKNGCKRLVKEFPGISDLVIHPGTPKMVQGGALVNMTAEFKLNGKPMKLERKDSEAFAIRLVGDQGADAALGKAERKMNAYILETITGSEWANRDADDLDEASLKSASVAEIDVTQQAELPQPAPTTRAQDVKDAMNKAAVAKAKEANKKGNGAIQTPATAQPSPTPQTQATPPAPAAEQKATPVTQAPATAQTPAVPSGVPTSGIPVGKKPRVHGFLNGKKIYHDKDGKQTTDVNQCADWQDAEPPAAAAAPTAVQALAKDVAQAEGEVTGEISTMTEIITNVSQKKEKPDMKVGYTIRDARNTTYLTFDRKIATDAKKLSDLKKKAVIEYLESCPIYKDYGKFEIVGVKEAPPEPAPQSENEGHVPFVDDPPDDLDLPPEEGNANQEM